MKNLIGDILYVSLSSSIVFLLLSPIVVISLAPFVGLATAIYSCGIFDIFILILIVIFVIVLSIYVYFTGYEKDRFNKK